jgi:hypothetical protein
MQSLADILVLTFCQSFMFGNIVAWLFRRLILDGGFLKKGKRIL